MIEVVVCGALGRMGSTVVKVAAETQDVKVVAGVEARDHPELGSDLGEVLGLGRLGAELTEDLSGIIGECDCVVEFTNPEATIEHLKTAADYGKPYVTGTTGFSFKQLKEIEKYASGIPILLSPNMSIGVNLLFRFAPHIAKTLGDSYDIEITEAHHRMKADAPSGTARKLGEVIAEALGRDLAKVGVHGRKGLTGNRSAEEIGIHSLRGGDITGDHTVLYAGQGERIELTHRAHSRETFAYGTMRAIRFIVAQRPGLYDMGDVLELK